MRPRSLLATFLCAASLALLPFPASSRPITPPAGESQAGGLLPTAVAVGDDFQVNTYTTSLQALPSIAKDDDGDVVIVYISRDVGTDFGIRGQRYASDGSKAGAEFIVNTYTTGFQDYPHVSMTGSGDFVVVWASEGSFGTDTNDNSVQGQRYASDGSQIGGQFQVNNYTTGFDTRPRVATDESGAFVVAWMSQQNDNGDSSNFGIQARQFASDGSAIGDSFLVNEITTARQGGHNIAAHDDHGFVVTWRSDFSTNPDPPSVKARRFGSDGSAIASEFQVNSYNTGIQGRSHISFLESGEFVVTYQSMGSDQGDTDGYSIRMRRFASGGTALASELQVNVYTTSNQTFPHVAASPSGEFIISWASVGSADGQDIDGQSIQAQRFTSSGLRAGSEFTVNSLTVGNQVDPVVAMDPGGDFTFSWTQDSATASDPSVNSVRARRFRVTGDLGDRVWVDSDGDGLQDPGEVGAPGVGVDLHDSGGALLASTVTDVDGRYIFSKVAQGDYTIRIPQLPGQFTDFTLQDAGGDDTVDSDFDGSGSTALITVDAAETDIDQDAGLIANRLGDRVWNDLNLNGRQDEGEPGFPGVTVELFTLLGASLGQTVTADDGSYVFEAVPPNRYVLVFSEPEGFCYTAQDQGDDLGDSDVDPLTLTTGQILVTAGQSDLSWDAGLVPDASIGNRVWFDDGDGIQDDGEEGVAGVTVRLFDDQSSLLDTAITDNDGLYAFAPGPGDYFLEVLLPVDMAFAPRDQGADDAADSDVDPATGTTSIFNLAPGAVDATRDAGIEPATIGNRVWLDADQDGLQQPGEPGYAGATVRLLNAADGEVASTVTDAEGLYGFLGVASGTYRIEVARPAGGEFSPQDVGADDFIDSDVDTVTGRTALFFYSAASASRSHDAGISFPPFFADGFESGDVSQWSGASP